MDELVIPKPAFPPAPLLGTLKSGNVNVVLGVLAEASSNPKRTRNGQDFVAMNLLDETCNGEPVGARMFAFADRDLFPELPIQAGTVVMLIKAAWQRNNAPKPVWTVSLPRDEWALFQPIQQKPIWECKFYNYSQYYPRIAELHEWWRQQGISTINTYSFGSPSVALPEELYMNAHIQKIGGTAANSASIASSSSNNRRSSDSNDPTITSTHEVPSHNNPVPTRDLHNSSTSGPQSVPMEVEPSSTTAELNQEKSLTIADMFKGSVPRMFPFLAKVIKGDNITRSYNSKFRVFVWDGTGETNDYADGVQLDRGEAGTPTTGYVMPLFLWGQLGERFFGQDYLNAWFCFDKHVFMKEKNGQMELGAWPELQFTALEDDDPGVIARTELARQLQLAAPALGAAQGVVSNFLNGRNGASRSSLIATQDNTQFATPILTTFISEVEKENKSQPISTLAEIVACPDKYGKFRVRANLEHFWAPRIGHGSPYCTECNEFLPEVINQPPVCQRCNESDDIDEAPDVSYTYYFQLVLSDDQGLMIGVLVVQNEAKKFLKSPQAEKSHDAISQLKLYATEKRLFDCCVYYYTDANGSRKYRLFGTRLVS